MLAMRVSFMNELARLCHATGADIHAVRLGVGSDTRIGKRFLYAGPGYGGSCFPKDVKALMHLGRSHGVPMRMAEATHLANEEQAQFLAALVEESVGVLEGKTVALWGLAFKPETDDVREAPSIKASQRRSSTRGRTSSHTIPRRGPQLCQDDGVARPTGEGGGQGLRGARWGARAGAPDGVAELPGAELRRDAQAAPRFGRRGGAGGHRRAECLAAGDVVRAGLRYQGIGVHAAPSASERAPKPPLR